MAVEASPLVVSSPPNSSFFAWTPASAPATTPESAWFQETSSALVGNLRFNWYKFLKWVSVAVLFILLIILEIFMVFLQRRYV